MHQLHPAVGAFQWRDAGDRLPARVEIVVHTVSAGGPHRLRHAFGDGAEFRLAPRMHRGRRPFLLHEERLRLALPAARTECRANRTHQRHRMQRTLEHSDVAKAHGEQADQLRVAAIAAVAERQQHERKIRPRRLRSDPMRQSALIDGQQGLLRQRSRRTRSAPRARTSAARSEQTSTPMPTLSSIRAMTAVSRPAGARTSTRSPSGSACSVTEAPGANASLLGTPTRRHQAGRLTQSRNAPEHTVELGQRLANADALAVDARPADRCPCRPVRFFSTDTARRMRLGLKEPQQYHCVADIGQFDRTSCSGPTRPAGPAPE